MCVPTPCSVLVYVHCLGMYQHPYQHVHSYHAYTLSCLVLWLFFLCSVAALLPLLLCSLSPSHTSHSVCVLCFQRECSYSVMDTIRADTGVNNGRHQTFVIIYRPDDQVSVGPPSSHRFFHASLSSPHRIASSMERQCWIKCIPHLITQVRSISPS